MAVPQDAVEYILEQLTKRLDEVAVRLEQGMQRLDGTYVRQAVFEQWALTADEIHKSQASALLAAMEASKITDAAAKARIDKMEESRQWLFRLCAGALLSALISVMVALWLASKGV